MNNILSAMLNQESAERAVKLAIAQSEAVEFSKALRKIHKVYDGYDDQVQALALRGDYNKPTIFGGRKGVRSTVKVAHGLVFHTGSDILKEEVSLRVVQRVGAVAGVVRLDIQRHHPHRPETIATYPIETPAAFLVQQAFAVLMRYLHEDSFTAKKPAVPAA